MLLHLPARGHKNHDFMDRILGSAGKHRIVLMYTLQGREVTVGLLANGKAANMV